MQTPTLVYQPDTDQIPVSTHHCHIPRLLCFLAMECTFLLLAAVLPLGNIRFYNAFLETNFGSWALFLTHLLFPGQAIIPSQPGHGNHPISLALSWDETLMLFSTFVLLFLPYILAVRFLPRRITQRYILISTALLGLTWTLIPVVTSQDIFSYIAYARIGVLYHLNPLTTLPTAIATDPVYPYLYWVHQPSAYGPTWAVITCALQWITLRLVSNQVLPMILLLRLFSLIAHLGSVQLIWSISGRLQRLYPFISYRRRLQATLAFAWNPFLLFEACINAHNDTTILFLILLATWFLVSRTQPSLQEYLLAAATLAVAACLKITFVLLAPGLLLFLWSQQPRNLRHVFAATALYAGVIILLYAPFWQHGEVYRVFQVNPSVYHAINTPYEFLSDLYANITGARIAPASTATGSPIEILVHRISNTLFLITYGMLCVQALRVPQSIRTVPSLFRWMALAWLLYCLIGTPWFWPWYSITFFGLYALVEVTGKQKWQFSGFSFPPYAVRLFAFCMLSLYCFLTWAPHATFLSQQSHFQWAYFRGLWAWVWVLLPLAVRSYRHISFIQRYRLQRQKL